jgi:hypothetical protein
MNELSQKYANINLKIDDSIASKEIGLNTMDNSLIGIYSVFRIRPQGNIRTTSSYNFTSKHCNKLKTITHNNKTYTSLYKPKDDEHAFYIHSINGRFIKYNKNEKIGDIIVLEDFLNKINEIIEINKLDNRFKKFSTLKYTIIALMMIGVATTGIYMLLLLYNLIFWLVSGKSEKVGYLYLFFYILVLFILYCYYKILIFYKKVFRFVIFKHILKKAEILEQEVENWNYAYFYQKNQKAVIADTYDYIQIFYDKSFVYEFFEHK